MSLLAEALASHRIAVVADLPPSGLAYLLASENVTSPLLVVARDDDRTEELTCDLRAFGVAEVEPFLTEGQLFASAAADPAIAFNQQSLRHRVLAGDRPRVIVTAAAALQARWSPTADFNNATTLWVAGEDVPQPELVAHLMRCGYNRVNLVEDPGTFAIRGGIVDIFAPDRARPVRLDQFGDEIVSIKAFDPDSQRTGEPEESLTVYPIRPVVFDDETVARAQARLAELAEVVDIPTRRIREQQEEIGHRHFFYGVEALWPLFYAGGESVLDTLLTPETVVVLDDATEIEILLDERSSRAERERERAQERKELALAVSELLESPGTVRERLGAHRQIRTFAVADDRQAGRVPIPLLPWLELGRELELRRKDAKRGEILDPVVEEIENRVARRHEVFLTCSTRGNAERLRELLLARRLDLPILPRLPDPETFGQPRRHPRCAIAIAALTAGFVDPRRGVALLTDVELFGTPPRRGWQRRRRRPPKEGLTTLRDLRPDDLIIHVDHGIGRYLGLTRLTLGGIDGDYVQVEYAGGDKLYVPIYRLNLLLRYQGPAEVRLDKLGGTRWEKTKQRVRDAVLGVAHNLLALQARRKAQPGFALKAPDSHFRAFEATFIHDETDDQRRAIEEVLADLVKPTPMDRLVCGDVGFGKTEVAVRAAFLAVLSGRQVAVLVPTTVLAEQHGVTFRERLAGEGVNIEVLSRFRGPGEIRDILRRLAAGQVDILIGTHRQLSPDVGFKNLGLLVVDEEQRFGVKHKERIKELRSQVHALTLTATPIPRTLHMAMMGLRDLSIIQTPPTERVSIRTEVTVFAEEVLQEAIRRELKRGGQVFIVHNRVETIDQMAAVVREYVPEAKIAIAHGQMSGEKLERIMVDFIRREHNVLVCTAIIESGIDIPSANTMIINRADTFGLAQLHQLRGRIGRGRERAYAHFLLPRSRKITREASERLAVLKRFSDLGAGFSIATQDLDIRGAGNLLGAEQSGSIAAVGVDLYTELLAEAVEKARGQRAHGEVEPDIKLPVAAVLPEAYMQHPVERLEYYQRMANADSDERIFDIVAEIEELYGKAPDELHHLGEVMVIRRRLKRLGATTLSGSFNAEQIKLGVSFMPEARVDRAALAQRLQDEPARYRLSPSGTLMITVPTLPETEPIQFLRRVRRELGELSVTALAG